ncbi:MAG: hypothetical protein AAF682_07485 [Planctomycetota bacterium]
MQYRVWNQAINHPAGASSFWVRFAYTRTGFGSVELMVGGRVVPLRWHGGVAVGRLDPPAEASGDATLVVKFRGEPPVRGSAGWEVVAEDPAIHERDLLGGPPWLELGEEKVEAERDQPDWALLQSVSQAQVQVAPAPPPSLPPAGPRDNRSVDELYEARENALVLHDAASRFFHRFDRATDRRLASEGLRLQMDLIQRRLARRIDARFHLAREEKRPHFPLLDAFGDEPFSLLRISRLMLKLADEELLCGDVPSCAPFGDPVDWAFFLFVSGRLAVTHPDVTLDEALLTQGAPTSQMYLMFAELGFLCLDNAELLPGGERARHVDFWSEHLPTLVASAQLLMEHPLPDLHRRPNTVIGFFDGMSIEVRHLRAARKAYREYLGHAPDLSRLAGLFGYLIGARLDDAPGSTGRVPTAGELEVERFSVPAAFRLSIAERVDLDEVNA